MTMLSDPVGSAMSELRPPASSDPDRNDGPAGWFRRVLRHPPPGLGVWAALAAAVTGGLVALLSVVVGVLAPALAGFAVAATALGLAIGHSVARLPHTDGGLRAELGLGSLMVAAGLIVGVYLLGLTASVTRVADLADRVLVRTTGLTALVLCFGTLGYALVMRRGAGGRHRPDWVFVVIALLMTGITLVQLYDRLALVLFLS
jgi:hypothetical protein